MEEEKLILRDEKFDDLAELSKTFNEFIDEIEKDEMLMRKRSIALAIALVGYDTSDAWWASKNAAFENKTPAEMWIKDPDRVYKYLCNNLSGDFL